MAFRMIEPHAVAAANLISSTVPEDDAPPHDPAATYAVGDLVTLGAPHHAIFESVAEANTGHDPAADTASEWWINIGSTNRWRAFDQYLGDPTRQADAAAWELAFTGATNALALFGVEAGTVQVEMRDSLGELVHAAVYDMQDESAVIDATSYCFGPIMRRDKLVVSDLPPYANAQLTLTVADTGGNVAVGQIVAGYAETLGDPIQELPLGIEDFSRKERDAFGRFSVLERDYADRMTVAFVYPTAATSYLTRRLAGRRARRTVFAADSRFAPNDYAVYGFFQNFQPIARWHDKSEAIIELEGLS